MKRHYIIDAVRISLSLIILYKCTHYLLNHFNYFLNHLSFILYPSLISTIFLMCGYQIRICSLLLIFMVSSYEIYVEIFNLGTATSNMLLLFFVLSHNKMRFKDEKVSYPTLIVHPLIIAFIICATVNFSAGILHLTDPYWQEGSALSRILKNSYYTNHYDFFEHLKNHHQMFFESTTKMLSRIQIILQLIMLPIAFIKYGFLLIRCWGIIFSLLSIIFFQISLLPYFYLSFWILTFYLPYNYKFELPFFRTSLGFKKFLAFYFLIALFTGASLSLFLKHKKISNKQLVNTSYEKLLKENKTEEYITLISKYFGLTNPNVFNSQDIQSNSKWVVIYNISNSQRKLIPFINENGSRLSYHSNDIIYYRDSIPIRRSLLANDLNQTMSHLIQISAYDYREHKNSRDNIYEFVFYEKHDSISPRNDSQSNNPVYSRRIDINPFL